MKNIFLVAGISLLAIISCKKIETTETADKTYDNTAQVEADAANATVDSADIERYDKDEAEMIDKSESEK